MAIDIMKFLMQNGYVSGGDMLGYAMNLYRRFKGGNRPSQESAKEGSESPPAPQAVNENKRVLDEALELYALLSGMRTAEKKPATQYQPKSEEFWIFPAIVERLKPGARKKALDILATSVVTVKGKRIVGYTRHKPEADGKPRKDTADTEEYVDEINRRGPEIVAGLTWFALQAQASPSIPDQPGVEPRLKGVSYVVSFLEASRLYENTEDTLAAGKETFQQIWQRLMKALGDYDTGLHMLFARVVVGGKDLRQQFADGTPGNGMLLAIEAEQDPIEKRKLQERLQRILTDMGKDAQAVRNAADRAANRRLLWAFIWFVIVGCLVVALIPNFD